MELLEVDNVETGRATRLLYSVFESRAKRIIVALCALAGFFSPFSAFTYFPALQYMAKDLNVSLQMMDLTITMFLVVQGIVPAVLGDIADQVGRRPVYILVLVLYSAACVGLALQTSYPALLALRMVQSAGSSGTIALGIMVVADLAPPHSRGRYVGAMLSGPNCGPSLGPVIGGVLAELAGWRWIFWMLALLGGICLVPIVIVFPETCRSVVGSGKYVAGKRNQPPIATLCPKNREHPPKNTRLSYKLQKIPNPFRCLRILASRHDALLLTSNAMFYVSYSCLHASLGPLAMQHYGLNALGAGLCYLPYGIATISSSYAVGKILDWDYRATARTEGIVINATEGDDLATFPVELARIRSVGYFIVAGICATIIFGWAIQKELHLSCMLVMTAVCGVTFTAVFNTCLTLNVDLHPTETGLASVAASLSRCLAAAVGVAIMQPLLESVGVGWTFTIFGLLSGLSIPMLLTLRIWGPSWRKCEWGASESSTEGVQSAQIS